MTTSRRSFIRTASTIGALAALPGERIHFIQVSDATAQAGEDILAETLGHRVPPGEGVVDWPRLLSSLESSGVDITFPFGNPVTAILF